MTVDEAVGFLIPDFRDTIHLLATLFNLRVIDDQVDVFAPSGFHRLDDFPSLSSKQARSIPV